MFKKTKTTLLGKVIADRVKGYTVWVKLPKKLLKRHPTTFIICPDFPVKIPKVLTEGAEKAPHTFTVKITAPTKPELRKALEHMIQCAKEAVIAGNKQFELYRFRESTVKIGVYLADLTYIFRVRQLSYTELKQIQKTGG